jgi:hypothetical protein
MDRKAIADSLRTLALDQSKRTKVSILWELLDDIEIALAAGVTQAQVVKELNKHGLEMSLASFGTTLRRLRKKRKGHPAVKTESDNRDGQTVQNTEDPELNSFVERGNDQNQSEEEEDNKQTIFNPSDLRKLLAKKVDLEALEKIGKELQRKKKDENRRN